MSSFIKTDLKNGVRTIRLNRPERKNAINGDMYKTITEILNEDATNDKVCVTIITGEGDFFSSGNEIKVTKPEDMFTGLILVENMISAFINYPKLLIVVVNGPSIGIGATMVSLCDVVYASDRATFDAPFVKLGLCAEGTSSFTFPFNMGRSKASEVLLLNHKLTAQEAYQFGLISKVIPHEELGSFIESLYKHGNLSMNSIINNKKLIMANFKNILCECNKREFNQLRECMESEDFLNAAMAFLSKKSKL